MLPKPRFQPVPAKLIGFIKLNQEVISIEVIEMESEAINAQERGSNSDRRSFVSIDKGMILGKAFQQSGSLLDDVPVIAALRPGQSRFQGALVAETWRPTK